MNIKELNKAAIEEDAKLGRTQLRVLQFPKKALRKSGDYIHKIPAYYKVIHGYEKSFKKEYSDLFNSMFLTKLKSL